MSSDDKGLYNGNVKKIGRQHTLNKIKTRRHSAYSFAAAVYSQWKVMKGTFVQNVKKKDKKNQINKIKVDLTHTYK